MEPPLSSDLSGWSALGFALPLAHGRFGRRYASRDAPGNDLDHSRHFFDDLRNGDVARCAVERTHAESVAQLQ